MISLCDQGNIRSLVQSIITIAQMPLEIFTETGGLKKDLNITGFTVAYYIQRIFFRQKLQGLFQILVKRSAFCKKCYMFCLTAAVYQTKLFRLGNIRKNLTGNIREEISMKFIKLPQPGWLKQIMYLLIAFKIIPLLTR